MPNDPLGSARAGDAAGFEALVRRHQPLVYGIAVRMLMDRQLAEDLSQEVFLQMYRSLASIESDDHLAFWLRRVTANRAIDQLRQEKRREDSVPAEEADLPAMVSSDDPLMRRHLAGLIAELAPAARAVLLLRYQEDLDPQEIARTLDMPVNTVKSHLKRSLFALRQRMSA